jgi:hypothetical protein
VAKEQQLLPRIQQSSASTVLTGNHHVWTFILESSRVQLLWDLYVILATLVDGKCMLCVVGFFDFDYIALTSISYCFQDVLGVGMHYASSACPMPLDQDSRRSWRIFNDGRSDEPCKQHISLVSLLTLLLSSSISPSESFG